MAEATVKTIQFLDPRIEPQPDPLYEHIIAPTQNQYYRIAASSCGQSSISFNNLTTLGIDRAYLDTMEIEYTVDIAFDVGDLNGTDPVENTNFDHFGGANPAGEDNRILRPLPFEWTFNSWPLSRCTEDIRVNINGGAFFSQPLSYISAKERYMNQDALAKSYMNQCPCYRAMGQTESGRVYDGTALNPYKTMQLYSPLKTYPRLNSRAVETQGQATTFRYFYVNTPECDSIIPSGYYDDAQTAINVWQNKQYQTPNQLPPTRLGVGRMFDHYSQSNFIGGYNNDVLDYDSTKYRWCGSNDSRPYARNKFVIRATIVEPIFCSPFSSRYDATWGRPLYNITSMDITYTLMDLKNMIRVANLTTVSEDKAMSSYTVNIVEAALRYQVLTIPPSIEKPLTTLVPYRRFVPYISNTIVNVADSYLTGAEYTFSSGVFTLNEIPTAIWCFIAPEKKYLQVIEADNEPYDENVANTKSLGNYDFNFLFGSIKHVNMSLANTTQILNNARPRDLYRIAKANGCEDSYLSWSGGDVVDSRMGYQLINNVTKPYHLPYGAGSVLRLKPGTDLIVPDQALIPGANANNMVFQVPEIRAWIPPRPLRINTYCVWLLFEYVGVAAISPGQCEITMNPLGNGDILDSTPVMSATSEETEGELSGTGFWDTIKKRVNIKRHLKDLSSAARLLKRIPGGKDAATWAAKIPAAKRMRDDATSGGAVVGRGLKDWL